MFLDFRTLGFNIPILSDEDLRIFPCQLDGISIPQQVIKQITYTILNLVSFDRLSLSWVDCAFIIFCKDKCHLAAEGIIISCLCS